MVLVPYRTSRSVADDLAHNAHAESHPVAGGLAPHHGPIAVLDSHGTVQPSGSEMTGTTIGLSTARRPTEAKRNIECLADRVRAAMSGSFGFGRRDYRAGSAGLEACDFAGSVTSGSLNRRAISCG
ncbi:MAG: hypothetical protein ACI8V4_003348 [Ilumatobacter sp.]